MRLAQAIKFDATFQLRHGFYYVYIFVSAVYVVVLRFLPPEPRSLIAPVIIFSDPSFLGFFFIGGIMLLERGQNILQNLFVTPFQVGEYLVAKVISLTFLALATSMLITVLVFGPAFKPLPLVAGVVLGSFVFTLLGFTLASRVRTLNEYIIVSPLYMTVFVLPLFTYFGIVKLPLLWLHPGHASLLLIGAAFVPDPLTPGELAGALVNLTAWTGIAYYWAYRWFCRYVILANG